MTGSENSDSPQLSVVVPLYNEEDNVAALLVEIEEALGSLDYEIVLVDDGSSDSTVNRIKTGPRVRILSFEENTGQSAATYAGIQAARGEIITLLDGDLQNDPADIPRLLEEIDKGVDLVCGYRANRKDTAFKRLQSRIANAVRSRFTGDGVRDTGCTLKAMRRDCRDALIPFTGMHRFIPALIGGAGFKVGEVAVNHRPRGAGTSKYGGGLKRAIPATRDMFAVRWFLSRRFFYRLKEPATKPRGDGRGDHEG
ncbi:MAG: glycosyltransferase family 2 protein [Verrucomicrobiales bacterium]